MGILVTCTISTRVNAFIAGLASGLLAGAIVYVLATRKAKAKKGVDSDGRNA